MTSMEASTSAAAALSMSVEKFKLPPAPRQVTLYTSLDDAFRDRPICIVFPVQSVAAGGKQPRAEYESPPAATVNAGSRRRGPVRRQEPVRARRQTPGRRPRIDTSLAHFSVRPMVTRATLNNARRNNTRPDDGNNTTTTSNDSDSEDSESDAETIHHDSEQEASDNENTNQSNSSSNDDGGSMDIDDEDLRFLRSTSPIHGMINSQSVSRPRASNSPVFGRPASTRTRNTTTGNNDDDDTVTDSGLTVIVQQESEPEIERPAAAAAASVTESNNNNNDDDDDVVIVAATDGVAATTTTVAAATDGVATTTTVAATGGSSSSTADQVEVHSDTRRQGCGCSFGRRPNSGGIRIRKRAASPVSQAPAPALRRSRRIVQSTRTQTVVPDPEVNLVSDDDDDDDDDTAATTTSHENDDSSDNDLFQWVDEDDESDDDDGIQRIDEDDDTVAAGEDAPIVITDDENSDAQSTDSENDDDDDDNQSFESTDSGWAQTIGDQIRARVWRTNARRIRLARAGMAEYSTDYEEELSILGSSDTSGINESDFDDILEAGEVAASPNNDEHDLVAAIADLTPFDRGYLDRLVRDDGDEDDEYIDDNGVPISLRRDVVDELENEIVAEILGDNDDGDAELRSNLLAQLGAQLEEAAAANDDDAGPIRNDQQSRNNNRFNPYPRPS